jgi:replicative DNA helicase
MQSNALPALFGDDNFIPPDPTLKSPLTNTEIEQAFIGMLLLRPKLLEHVPISFSAEHFYWPFHSEIYDAIVAMGAGADDTHSIIQAISLGQRDKAEYVLLLLASNVMVDTRSATSRANTITNLWKRRCLSEIGRQLQAQAGRANGNMDCDGIIAETLNRIDEVASLSRTGGASLTLVEAVDRAVAAGQKVAAGQRGSVLTGIPSVDKWLGGMEPGGVYVLAGRPGMGKTALGVKIGVNVAKMGAGVELVSLEMQGAQIGRRALADLAAVPLAVLKNGTWTTAQAERIAQARAKLLDLPFTIDDQSGLNVPLIGLKARTAQRKHGLALLIVDHLHIIGQDAAVNRMGATWGVGQVSNGLKRLAKDMGIPILALAQLKRLENRDDKRPTLEDLRQSGEIEQDAESVMFVYREEYYLGTTPPPPLAGKTAEFNANRISGWEEQRRKCAGKAEIIFAKMRDGEPGTAVIGFNGACTSFYELSAPAESEGFWV